MSRESRYVPPPWQLEALPPLMIGEAQPPLYRHGLDFALDFEDPSSFRLPSTAHTAASATAAHFSMTGGNAAPSPAMFPTCHLPPGSMSRIQRPSFPAGMPTAARSPTVAEDVLLSAVSSSCSGVQWNEPGLPSASHFSHTLK